jgi:hypothetical protein
LSLHAGVAAGVHQRDKVERLCRYIARLAHATGRFALTAQGQVRCNVAAYNKGFIPAIRTAPNNTCQSGDYGQVGGQFGCRPEGPGGLPR